MKIKITLLALVVCCVSRMSGQILITENFNNPSTLTSTLSGWIQTNKSAPQGITSWFPGTPGVFPAFSSPDSTYIAANYNNTTGNTGVISNWLLTPTVTLNNGGILQFATRTNTAAPQSIAPDRLQVYMSTAGTSTDVGLTSTSVGSFSTLLVAVNPSLVTTGAGAYPTVWTVYTVTLANITGTVTGRFGFRYSVTSAGPTGTNSSYIGIDNVKYDLPCPNPTLSVSSTTTGICSGNSLNIGASGATTYTWSSGQNTPSIAVSPTVNTVYTLTASSIPKCNSTASVAITVTLTPNLAVSNVTTCAGTAATITASGANSYSWSTGSSSATIVDTPTMNTTYTVTGYNGNCSRTNTVSVAIGASLSVNATTQQSLICSGRSATLISSGASTYSYSAGTFTTSNHTSVIAVTPTANTVYTIDGSSGACFGTATIQVNVNPSPNVSITVTGGQNVCPNSAITLTAAGASTYSWTGYNSTNAVLATTTPSTVGSVNFAVVGTGTNGCTGNANVLRIVDPCTGIEALTGNKGNVAVYPNPFTNELKIAGLTNGSIEIYNALGQLVLKEVVNVSAQVNTSELAKGIYILKAFSDENKLLTTVKLVRN